MVVHSEMVFEDLVAAVDVVDVVVVVVVVGLDVVVVTLSRKCPNRRRQIGH